MTVDEYVTTKVLPPFQAVVAMLRALMREHADVEEVFSYGMPCYKGKRIFAWILSSKRDITFGFARGLEFEDRYKLLRGAGKGSRHLKLKDLDSVSKETLDYYVQQALELDKQ